MKIFRFFLVVISGLAIIVISYLSSGHASATNVVPVASREDDQTDAIPVTWINNAVARNAVCNDGSPSGYYFVPSTTGSTVWVIHMQGGGYCYDNASCASRRNDPEKNTSISSVNWESNPPVEDEKGILNPNPLKNPYFYNANRVYMRYCSSDLFSGNRVLTLDGSISWYFRGRAILQATLEDLGSPTNPSLPSLQDATKVLLSGGSASGISIFPALDWAAGQLQTMYGITYVKGLSDAGWLVELTPLGPGILPASEQMQSGYEYWHAQGNIDSDCEAANVGNEWRCYFGSYSYDYISTPLFVYNSQYDEDALVVLGAVKPYDEAELAFRDQYRAEIVDTMSQVNITNAFVPISQEHAIAVHAESQTLQIHGVSLQEMLGPWFYDMPGIPKLVQDSYYTYVTSIQR